MGKQKNRILLIGYTEEELIEFTEWCLQYNLFVYHDEVSGNVYGLLPTEEFRNGEIINVGETEHYLTNFGFYSIHVNSIKDVKVDTNNLFIDIYITDSDYPTLKIPFDTLEDLEETYLSMEKKTKIAKSNLRIIK